MISNQENSEVSGHPNRSEVSSTFNAFNNNNKNIINEKPPIQQINNKTPEKKMIQKNQKITKLILFYFL